MGLLGYWGCDCQLPHRSPRLNPELCILLRIADWDRFIYREISMIKSPKLVSKFVTAINPDCVKVSPFDSSIFCLGHYRQIQGETVEGAISILNTSDIQKVSQIRTTPSSAVLHLCWVNQKINDREFVLAACRDSCIRVFEHTSEEGLVQRKTIEIPHKELYCLYIDCVVDSGKINVVISTNIEKTFFFVLDFGFNIEEQREFADHQYAVWCCRINPFAPHTFFSGDEISSLIAYDMRANPQKILKNSKIHQNGVSDIVFTNREHELITGTFDGCLRWFDTRNINKSLKEYRTDGVIWRIIGNEMWTQALLCRSSVNIFSICDLGVDSKTEPNQTIELKEHQSLAYGADWNASTIVTASFYDKLVCVWEQ